jgi:single-strand DNA-binding protein
MASDLNQIKMDGRLAGDPKVKELEGGARVATVRVANNRYFKGRDEPEWKERTGFFEVQGWNAMVDTLAGLTKGQPVHIEGALGQDNWTDAEGKPHSRIMIEATKVEQRELKREKVEERRGSAHEL